MLLRHIDAIARQEGRDVVLVKFFSGNNPNPAWEKLPIRKQVIKWLDSQGFRWEPCGEWASENSIIPYLGTIYVRIPYDEESRDYQKLRAYLEKPDGSSRYDSAYLCFLKLSEAMKNAHHDEPGFWERWAESF